MQPNNRAARGQFPVIVCMSAKPAKQFNSQSSCLWLDYTYYPQLESKSHVSQIQTFQEGDFGQKNLNNHFSTAWLLKWQWLHSVAYKDSF